MIVTPEAWTVLGTGVVILIAIATAHRKLRGDMKALRDELRGDMKEDRSTLDGKIDDIRAELGGLRERMAKLEGLLVGLREAISGRQVA